jgi:hypothetical protein
MTNSIKAMPSNAVLKPFNEFQRIISPLLARVAPEERKLLLERIYALAGQKMHQEEVKRFIVDSIGASRKERVQLRRKRAHIGNAIKELLAADKLSAIRTKLFTTRVPSTSTERWVVPLKDSSLFDFEAAVQQLRLMDQELQEIEHLFVATVHPKLRTSVEKSYPIPSPRDRTTFPAIKATAIEYWFISALDKCIPIRDQAELHRIISKIFDAAFGEGYGIDRVKTALRRLPKRTPDTLPKQGQKA